MHIIIRMMRILPLLLASFLLLTSSSWAASKPNVLFLFADDMRPDVVGAFGHPVVKTPTIDSLVQRGFTFNNTYCFGSNSGAVCNPSRNMLLSGRVYFRFKGQATPDKPNFAASFNAAGYETYHHGKRGNTALALQKIFNHDKYLKNDEVERKSGGTGKEIVDPAIAFLKSRKTDKPFCMYLAFANPHDARVASEKHLKMYDQDAIPLPKNYLPYHPFNNGELLVRDERLAPWPRTKSEVRKQLRDYYAVITGLDEQMGRLLATLKELKLDENTIVIFSADHGLAMGSHGLFGKQSLYEHSMKAPLVYAGPGIPKGETNAFGYLHDIYPTACALAGIEQPSGIDGVNQQPVILGKEAHVRDTIFTSYKDVQRAVRHGDWKLIVYPKINKTQLFNLKTDPDEIVDLASDSKDEKKLQELLAIMKKQQAINGDKLPLTSEKPAKAEVDESFFKTPPPKKKKK